MLKAHENHVQDRIRSGHPLSGRRGACRRVVEVIEVQACEACPRLRLGDIALAAQPEQQALERALPPAQLTLADEDLLDRGGRIDPRRVQIDRALEQVQKAIEHEYEHTEKMETDGDLSPLHSDPRFSSMFNEWREKRADLN
jgi:hypothetical protein